MAIKEKVPCPRCDGKGVIPQYFYNRKGICFLCWGDKYVYIKVPKDRDKREYLKELREKEVQHLKDNPPKVEMPDKKDHKNPAYFKDAKTKLAVGDAKPNPEPKPKPNFNDGEPTSAEDVKVPSVKVIDTDYLETMSDEKLQELIKFSTDKVQELRERQAIWRKRKSEGKIPQRELTKALNQFVPAIMSHNDNIDNATEELNKRAAALQQEELLRKTIREKFKEATIEQIYSFIESLDSNRSEADRETRKMNRVIKKELRELIEEKYQQEKDKEKADLEQFREVYTAAASKVGTTPEKLDRQQATPSQYQQVIDELSKNEYKDNKAIQNRLDRLKYVYNLVAKKFEKDRFLDKYLPKDEDGYRSFDIYTEEQVQKALDSLDEVKDEDNKSSLREYLAGFKKRLIEYRSVRSAKNRETEFIEERIEKRREIVSNITFKNTALGKKVKELVGDGVKDSKQAQEIGKVVAADYEKEVGKAAGFSYKEFAKKYEAYRDVVKEFDILKAEIKKVDRRRFDMRVKAESRIEAEKRYHELREKERDLRLKIVVARELIDDYQDKLEEAKEKAYLATLNKIRDMGGEFNLEAAKSEANAKPIRDMLQNNTQKFFPSEWIEASNLTPLKIVQDSKRAFHRGESNPTLKILPDGSEEVTENPGLLSLDIKRNGPSVFVHEMQHRMEDIHPNLKELMRNFYVEKTKGKKPKWLGSGYNKDEIFIDIEGGWTDDYMGKFYNIAGRKGNSMDNVGWEIGTMALEMIAFDVHQQRKRLDFFQKDVYHFMLGVMAGV